MQTIDLGRDLASLFYVRVFIRSRRTIECADDRRSDLEQFLIGSAGVVGCADSAAGPDDGAAPAGRPVLSMRKAAERTTRPASFSTEPEYFVLELEIRKAVFVDQAPPVREARPY